MGKEKRRQGKKKGEKRKVEGRRGEHDMRRELKRRKGRKEENISHIDRERDCSVSLADGKDSISRAINCCLPGRVLTGR